MVLYSSAMNDAERTFDIDELAALTDTSVRTIRFYIQEGLLPRPLSLGRGARYAGEHLEALLAIRRWQKAGLSLERIRELLAGAETEVPPPARRAGTIEVWSHLIVRPGIELHVEPQQAGLSPEATRALFRAVLDAVNRLHEKAEEKPR
jgi:DNA-binding transcriptional MerR regulator